MKFEAELQFKPMNAHNFIKVKILQQISSYIMGFTGQSSGNTQLYKTVL